MVKLIADGNTVHIAYGVLHHLRGKRDLGLHTEVVSDAVIDLIEEGVVSGLRRRSFPGASSVRSVSAASACTATWT